MKGAVGRVAVGILIANEVSVAIILAICWAICPRRSDYAGVYILSSFTYVPILMGYILEAFRYPLGLTAWQKVGTTLLSFVVAVALATTVLHEGALCLVMAAPIVLAFHALGAHIAYRIYTARNSRLQVSFVPIVLLLIAGDVVSPHAFRSSEADTIVVHARPEAVWRYVVAYPENRRPLDYWLWSIGLPAPLQSTAPVQAVGGSRTCAFTGGVAAEERITEFVPGRTLAFDVTRQPDHPEIVGHFTLERGQFDLRDNGDGTTTMVGTSWYSLHVFPAVYYDLWVRDIVGHVHLRVMRHIKALAEADEARDGSVRRVK